MKSFIISVYASANNTHSGEGGTGSRDCSRVIRTRCFVIVPCAFTFGRHSIANLDTIFYSTVFAIKIGKLLLWHEV